MTHIVLAGVMALAGIRSVTPAADAFFNRALLLFLYLSFFVFLKIFLGNGIQELCFVVGGYFTMHFCVNLKRADTLNFFSGYALEPACHEFRSQKSLR